jgi:hypothetical protein
VATSHVARGTHGCAGLPHIPLHGVSTGHVQNLFLSLFTQQCSVTAPYQAWSHLSPRNDLKCTEDVRRFCANTQHPGVSHPRGSWHSPPWIPRADCVSWWRTGTRSFGARGISKQGQPTEDACS